MTQGLRQISNEQAAWVASLISRTWDEADPKSIAREWRAAMAFDSRARLKEIKCPTLVIAGSGDNAVLVHHALMLRDGIAGSKLVVIEGADHAVLGAHSDQLLRAVNEFLSV
jgi:pimeloyl-ACP methyl ester carboxylesterase